MPSYADRVRAAHGKKPPAKKSGGGFFHALTHNPAADVYRSANKAVAHTPGLRELSRVGNDAASLAYGTPIGLYHTVGGVVHHPGKTAKQLGRGQAKAVSDLGSFHQWEQHPGFQLATALGIASLGGGAIARSSAAMRAAEGEKAAAFMKKPLYRRVVKGTNKETPVRKIGPNALPSEVDKWIPNAHFVKTPQEFRQFKAARTHEGKGNFERGMKEWAAKHNHDAVHIPGEIQPTGGRSKTYVFKQPSGVIEKPQTFVKRESPNPVLRGLEKGHERVYQRSLNKEGFYAKRRSAKMERNAERFATSGRPTASELRKMIPAQDIRTPGQSSLEKAKAGAKASVTPALPTNILRLFVTARGRYAVQNALQSAIYGGLNYGPHGLVKGGRYGRRAGEEARHLGRAASGVTSTQSLGIGVKDAGSLSHLLHKMQGIMSMPEGKIRQAALMREMQRAGVKSERAAELLKRPRSLRYQDLVRATNEAQVDFGRLGPKERAFVGTQIPMFYPMFKNTARWAAQYPGQHSAQVAAMVPLAKKGMQQRQKDFPKGVPPYYRWLVKSGKNKTLNFANVLPYSPGVEIASQALASGRRYGPSDVNTLMNMLGPAFQLPYEAITGRDPVTGWKVKGVGKGGRPPTEAIKDILLNMIPGSDLAHPRVSKTVPRQSLLTNLGLWAAGPGVVPTNRGKAGMKEIAAQAERFAPPKGKRKSGGGGGGSYADRVRRSQGR